MTTKVYLFYQTIYKFQEEIFLKVVEIYDFFAHFHDVQRFLQRDENSKHTHNQSFLHIIYEY